MKLEVTLHPCSERDRLYHRGNRSISKVGLAWNVRFRNLYPNDRFTVTCFQDVRMWANLNSSTINGKGGPYYYYLNIGPPGGPWTYWEMPHGDMILEDRLWIPLEMYEAFYVEAA